MAAAENRAATKEELARSIQKTGDTVFIPRSAEIETEGAFVPVSRVNAVRREALERLAEARIAAFAPDTGEEGTYPEICLPEREIPDMAYVRTAGQAEAARAAGLRVVRCPEDYRAEALEALRQEIRPGDWFALPDVCEEETLRTLRRWTEENRELLGGVVLGSVGQLGTDWPAAYGAGPGIPVMNRQAASLLFEQGCEFVTASPELTGQELKTLLAGGAPIVTAVYGRTRLMLLHHCPARTALGLSRGHRDCRMCDEGHPDALAGQALEDRRGYRFPLLRQRLPEGCLVQLMNAFPTDNISQFRTAFRHSQAGERGLPRALILTAEERDETEEVLAAFAEGRKSGGETTAGHWKRPVE